jgi:hypothetical protein
MQNTAATAAARVMTLIQPLLLISFVVLPRGTLRDRRARFQSTSRMIFTGLEDDDAVQSTRT